MRLALENTVQVHVPYRMLCERIEDIVEAEINPEVFIDGALLDDFDSSAMNDVAAVLKDNGLRCTVHGPYSDLSPGGVDEGIRLFTCSRFKSLLDITAPLEPVSIVLHAGYDARHYDGNSELWLEQSLKTWPDIVKLAEDHSTTLALENVFEDDPETFRMLLGEIASPSLGVCLDAGHINVFSSSSMEEWFKVVGERLREVYVHDNNGSRDEHLAVGDGDIDFDLFFSLLEEHGGGDVVYTIEPHGEEVLWRGLKAIRRYL